MPQVVQRDVEQPLMHIEAAEKRICSGVCFERGYAVGGNQLKDASFDIGAWQIYDEGS